MVYEAKIKQNVIIRDKISQNHLYYCNCVHHVELITSIENDSKLSQDCFETHGVSGTIPWSGVFAGKNGSCGSGSPGLGGIR